MATLSSAIKITPGITTTAAYGCDNATIGPAKISGGTGSNMYKYSWSDDRAFTTLTRSSLGAGDYTLFVEDMRDSSVRAEFMYTIAEYPPISIIVAGAITHVDRNGQATGSIDEAVVSGGYGDYLYEWTYNDTVVGRESAITSLKSGMYTLKVLDSVGSLPAAFVYNVHQNAMIEVISEGRTSPALGPENQGSISSPAIKGGNGFYLYNWADNVAVSTPTRTGLATGSYTLSIMDTAGAAPVRITYEVLEYTPVEIKPGEITHTTLSASSGSILPSTVMGGNGHYSYSWSDQMQVCDSSARCNLAPGAYTLTVTSSEMSATHTFYVQLLKKRSRQYALSALNR